MYKPDYGDSPSPLKEDEIPVFWACGNTIKEVLKHTKHPLSFTMYSDCMYLSDIPSDSESSAASKVITPDGEQPVVVDMVDDPYQASLVSEAVLQKLKQLQNVLREGNVSIGTEEDGFMKNILTLSHSSYIIVAVVLPHKKDNGYETNGFMGTLAMVNMLKAVGKEVTLVVDTESFLDITKIVEVLVQKGLLQESVNVVQFPDTTNSSSSARDILTQSDGNTPRFDHLVMPIQTSDNDNRMCKQLFSAAKDLNVFTFQGSQQCSSDVYGYAITIALYLLGTCSIHDRYRRRGVGFPPSDSELQVFKAALPSIKTVASVLAILQTYGLICNTGTDHKPTYEDPRSTIERLYSVLK
ncbi:D-glutamate cyclase, mitochondrial-like [Amphiura filiformis]|uniref:D-glutamate cyclase, mitochondrial-like n=1 Tax=Amphiura filiformis TaxID=82378 RepID=UPI003B21355B